MQANETNPAKPIKLHRNLTEAVANAIHKIFVGAEAAGEVVENLLQSNPRWGARDRHYIADSIYQIVRYYRLYCFCAGIESVETGEDIRRLFAAKQIINGGTVPPWIDAPLWNEKEIKERIEQAKSNFAIWESIPDWMDKIGREELGERWEEEVHALNQPAPLVLRVNPLRSNMKQVQQWLMDEDIVFSEHDSAPNAIIIKQRKNLSRSEPYKSGWFEIQDVSSQMVAPLLQAKEGMRVIDACAGAGGKTLHIAALMQNKGEIIALDVWENKLTELRSRCNRAGVHIVKKELVTDLSAIKKYEGTADRLLIDAPCSGIGVLKRNPDAKCKLSLAFIDQVRQEQQQILNDYSRLLKEGGLMVYATCSILPSENEQQVTTFLNSQEGKFQLISEDNCSPVASGFDGFYMAVIKRL